MKFILRSILCAVLFCQGVALAQTNMAREFAIALRDNDRATIRDFIEQEFDVNHPEVRNYLGRMALDHAVHVRDAELVELFLRAGADPNFENHQQRTPIYQAAYTNDLDIVTLLLENGAKLNWEDYFRWTPLEFLERMILKTDIAENQDYTEVLDALKTGPHSTSAFANE